jgi:hypothetical protein
MLCGSNAYDNYLSNYNGKFLIAKQESRGGNLKSGVISNIFHRGHTLVIISLCIYLKVFNIFSSATL